MSDDEKLRILHNDAVNILSRYPEFFPTEDFGMQFNCSLDPFVPVSVPWGHAGAFLRRLIRETNG